MLVHETWTVLACGSDIAGDFSVAVAASVYGMTCHELEDASPGARRCQSMVVVPEWVHPWSSASKSKLATVALANAAAGGPAAGGASVGAPGGASRYV